MVTTGRGGGLGRSKCDEGGRDRVYTWGKGTGVPSLGKGERICESLDGKEERESGYVGATGRPSLHMGIVPGGPQHVPAKGSSTPRITDGSWQVVGCTWYDVAAEDLCGVLH